MTQAFQNSSSNFKPQFPDLEALDPKRAPIAGLRV